MLQVQQPVTQMIYMALKQKKHPRPANSSFSMTQIRCFASRHRFQPTETPVRWRWRCLSLVLWEDPDIVEIHASNLLRLFEGFASKIYRKFH